MATILCNNVSLVSSTLLPINRLGFNPLPRCSLRVLKSSPPILAIRSSSLDEAQPEPFIDETKSKIGKNILACPICYELVTWNGNHDLSLESMRESTLQCKSCMKLYCGDYNDSHIDLTINAGDDVSGEPLPASIELYRSPWVSFLYERGWRQCFSLAGFPGPEKEFEMIKEYLKPVLGGNIIDASCGSGMFSRLFAKSGLFSFVVALDFSEAMLRQCYNFIKQDDTFPGENLIMVRADISRLPFGSSSVDAVHAGAALHCWPSPSAAVAEISRVLKPGGLFVATTFVFDDVPQYSSLITPLRETIALMSGMTFYLSEKELEDLCTSCGLIDFKCTRNRNFVMISAMKNV